MVGVRRSDRSTEAKVHSIEEEVLADRVWLLELRGSTTSKAERV